MIIRLTGSKSGVIHKELPNDDPRRRRPDVTKAEHVLGWASSTPLEAGIEKTIGFFDRLLNYGAYPPLSSGAGRDTGLGAMIPLSLRHLCRLSPIRST